MMRVSNGLIWIKLLVFEYSIVEVIMSFLCKTFHFASFYSISFTFLFVFTGNLGYNVELKSKTI